MTEGLVLPVVNDRGTRMVKTAVVAAANLMIGLVLGLLSPTLLDLQQQVNTDLPTISFSVTLRSGGMVLGALTS